MGITLRHRSRSASGIGGKLGGTIFFGLFAAVGTLFFVMLGAMAWQTVVVFSWNETACTILESSLDTSAGSEWRVRYRYEVAGEEFESTQLSTRGFSRDFSADLRASQQYVPGEPARCYVDPDDPASAVLVRNSLWTALWALFPLPFMAVGYGGIVYTWRRPRAPREGAAATPALTAGARSKTGAAGTVFVVLFFGAFFLIGAGLTWALGVRPLMRVMDARAWKEVPCTVVASRVEEHDSDDGTTYSVRIVYRYEIDGRTFTADRYKFMTGSSSGRAGKAEIVRHYPPGTKTTCFVNPADPTDAVIERELTGDMAFGFIPLVFALVGGGGLVGFMVHRARGPTDSRFRREARGFQRSTSATIPPSAPGATATGMTGGEGPVVLEVQGSRTGKFIGLLIFSLFWNGIVSIFVVNLIGDWSRGGPQWFFAIFLLPFIAIGLFMFGLSIHAGLAMFNPRPRLLVSAAALPPGGTLEVRWEMTGNPTRLRSFRITLEGREEATYRRGTDTRTDKEKFAELLVAEAHDPAGIAAGSARLSLPANTMHSFEAKNNKIVWTLHVRGEIPRWPDVDDEFPFTVLAHVNNPFLVA